MFNWFFIVSATLHLPFVFGLSSPHCCQDSTWQRKVAAYRNAACISLSLYMYSCLTVAAFDRGQTPTVKIGSLFRQPVSWLVPLRNNLFGEGHRRSSFLASMLWTCFTLDVMPSERTLPDVDSQIRFFGVRAKALRLSSDQCEKDWVGQIARLSL